jgi:hypothetical protein
MPYPTLLLDVRNDHLPMSLRIHRKYLNLIMFPALQKVADSNASSLAENCPGTLFFSSAIGLAVTLLHFVLI